MGQVGDAEQVVLQGYWRDEDGAGVDGTITLAPVPLTGQSGATPNLKDATSYSYIQTKQRVATPDPSTGYFAVLALASNDPDVDAYGGRKVTFSGGYTPYTIQVPYNAPTTTVTSAMAAQVPSLTVGASVRALWLIDAPDGSNPPTPVDSYYTSDQTNSLLEQYAVPLVGQVNTVADAGAAQTLPDVTAATAHDLTLTAASCALTFPTSSSGKTFLLVLRQDATGGRAVTWPNSVKWPSGTAPSLSSAAGAVDAVTFQSVAAGEWLGLHAALDLQ